MKIDLEQIQESAKRVYETSSEISLLQEELENLLTAIDQNFLRYQRGEIPKNFFKVNEKRLKEESARRIKKVNELLQNVLNLLERIEKSIQIKRVENANSKKD